MPLQQQKASQTDGTSAQSVVESESIIVRNYDHPEFRTIDITLRSAEGDIALQRSVPTPPLATVSLQAELERAVYDVTAETAGKTASAECLVGGDPSECALIETGNGTVSVVDGL